MPVRLTPRPADLFTPCARGTVEPRAIRWFGFSAFWGHLRHLLASAIATENIDSRTWMIPDPPADVLEGMIAVLAARGAKPAATLVDAMGGELWVDFIADTGDDVTVSEAVARLLAEEYDAPDPDDADRRLVLPRGHLLFHGGDLAYPVATSLEMARRLVEPWNRVLETRSTAVDDAAPRVLVAVPGNHDWYDGLDGFARLCQAPCSFEEPVANDALHPAPSTSPVRAWAQAFARGSVVRKPGAMALAGYVPVQRASYFRVPLTKDVELFAVDRQLRHVDPRQQAYFAVPGTGTARLLVLPDPARAWGENRPDGVASLASLGVVPSRDPSYVLAGDVHHYERSHEGPSVHVVAGGGGAFLHGSRIATKGSRYDRTVEFPGPVASRGILARLPWQVARGGAGWVVTSVLAFGDAVALIPAGLGKRPMSLELAGAMSVSVAFGAALLVGWRHHRLGRVVAFSILLGIVVGALPILLGLALDAAGVRELGTGNLQETVTWVAAWLLATWSSGFAFGGLLQLIAILGLNHAQPYAALGDPGYKHFLRLRIRQSGEGKTTVDSFVIGQVDPVGVSPAVLVDSFRWEA